MIPHSPLYFMLLSSIILGANFRFALPSIGLISGGIVLAFFLRRAYRERSIALLGIFALMLFESVFFVAATIHFALSGEPRDIIEGSRSIFELFNHLDFGLGLLGAVAAGAAAVFVEFGKSRMSLSKAFPQVTFLEAPTQVKEMVARLAASARIQAPDVRLIDSGVPSAFTVRANRKYSVTVSVGLLESLDYKEVEACLAHEVAHLKNNDFTVRFMATLAKVALFARPLSYVLEPAVYRAREFLADLTAVKLVGGPDVLISVLSKLKESSDFDSALPSSSCVCNLSARKGLLRIFDKHPALEHRLKILREMKQE